MPGNLKFVHTHFEAIHTLVPVLMTSSLFIYNIIDIEYRIISRAALPKNQVNPRQESLRQEKLIIRLSRQESQKTSEMLKYYYIL